VAEKRKVPKSEVSLDRCCKLPYVPLEALDTAACENIVWPHLSDPKMVRQVAELQLQENDTQPQLEEHLK